MNCYFEVFKKEHNELKKTKDKCYELHKLFTEMKVAAKCTNCPVEKAELYEAQDKQYQHCRKDKACKAVVKCHKKLMEAENKQFLVREKYAKKIYDYFAPSFPTLIRCQTGEAVSWGEAFGTDFDKTTTANRNSIVALIEEDGGQYRFEGGI